MSQNISDSIMLDDVLLYKLKTADLFLFPTLESVR